MLLSLLTPFGLVGLLLNIYRCQTPEKVSHLDFKNGLDVVLLDVLEVSSEVGLLSGLLGGSLELVVVFGDLLQRGLDAVNEVQFLCLSVSYNFPRRSLTSMFRALMVPS